MPLIRIWFITYSLPQSELEKLRLVRQGLDHKVGPAGKVKIRYNKHRCSLEREFPSVEKAIEWAKGQKTANREFPEVYDEFTRVFGACEAKYGQKCEELEGAFFATEQDLFSSEVLESCGK